MKTFFKILLMLVCFICVWSLITLPNDIVVSINGVDTDDTFAGAFIALSTLILVGLGFLLLIFSLLGAALITFIIVTFTLAVVGVSLSWPFVLAAVVLYFIFSKNKQQKIQD